MNKKGTRTKKRTCSEWVQRPYLWAVLIIITLVAVGALSWHRPPFPQPAPGKVYFGVQIDTNNDSVAAYSARLGRMPAVVGTFVSLPLTAKNVQTTDRLVNQLAPYKAGLMLTVQPSVPLRAITPADLAALTANLTRWNKQDVPVLVRYAHEMNGSWYAWGQSPAAYIASFRAVAQAVHKAPHAATLWSPNEGGGYPYIGGGPYAAQPGTAAFRALDTNHDGKLTDADDPYAPYYPGDDVVDWVGLTIYHFGTTYPWGENEVPAPHKLEQKITGTYDGAGDNETAVPDFYATYAKGHHKPFAISETGAFYNTSRTDGASELAIKSAWWDQLFSPALESQFPQLKLAMWFEYKKAEPLSTGTAVVDWRAMSTAQTTNAFRAALPDQYITEPLKK